MTSHALGGRCCSRSRPSTRLLRPSWWWSCGAASHYGKSRSSRGAGDSLLAVREPPTRAAPGRAFEGVPSMLSQPFSILKGFGVTFRHIFRKPITKQYPEFKRAVHPRFRGRHRPHRHENGLEKCVGRAVAPRPACSTASASSQPRPPETASRPASAMRASTRSTWPLHLLPIPRARLSVRRDHARERVRVSEYSRDDLI